MATPDTSIEFNTDETQSSLIGNNVTDSYIKFKTSPIQLFHPTFTPYPNTTIEFNTDPVVCARIGISDSIVEFNTDPVVCARIGISDSIVEFNTNETNSSLIGNDVKNSSIEFIIESDGGDGGFIPQVIFIDDNTTETVVVGNKNSVYAIYIDFTIIKLTSSDTITGKIYISHDGINTDMDVEYIDELGGSEGISFDSRINGSNIELDVTATSVGENLKMIYYIRQTL